MAKSPLDFIRGRKSMRMDRAELMSASVLAVLSKLSEANAEGAFIQTKPDVNKLRAITPAFLSNDDVNITNLTAGLQVHADPSIVIGAA
jgi:hypothetical protein